MEGRCKSAQIQPSTDKGKKKNPEKEKIKIEGNKKEKQDWNQPVRQVPSVAPVHSRSRVWQAGSLVDGRRTGRVCLSSLSLAAPPPPWPTPPALHSRASISIQTMSRTHIHQSPNPSRSQTQTPDPCSQFTFTLKCTPIHTHVHRADSGNTSSGQTLPSPFSLPVALFPAFDWTGLDLDLDLDLDWHLLHSVLDTRRHITSTTTGAFLYCVSSHGEASRRTS